MSLRPKFEPVHAAHMNRETFPDLNTCIQEVLQEETRLKSTRSLVNESKVSLTNKDFTPVDEAPLLTARGQRPQCHECKKYGQIARNCR